MKSGKLMIIGGEHAMLVSHLSSFSYIDIEEAKETLFQALSVNNIVVKKNDESMSSLKDAQFMVENGQSTRWGQVFELAENKNQASLDFSPGATRRDLKRIQEVLHSAGFIHSKYQSATVILEEDEELGVPTFMTRGSMCQNWIVVDVPFVIHLSK